MTALIQRPKQIRRTPVSFCQVSCLHTFQKSQAPFFLPYRWTDSQQKRLIKATSHLSCFPVYAPSAKVNLHILEKSAYLRFSYELFGSTFLTKLSISSASKDRGCGNNYRCHLALPIGHDPIRAIGKGNFIRQISLEKWHVTSRSRQLFQYF